MIKKFLTSQIFLVVIAVIIVLGAFGSGVYVGYDNRPAFKTITDLVHKDTPVTVQSADFDPFWKVWQLLNEKFVQTHGTSTEPVSNDKKVWGAIQGLTASLGDPYTVFFPPQESKDFTSEINGNFEGVGMEIGIRDNVLTVVTPIKGSPAEKAGMQSGDKIIRIGDVSTEGISVEKAVDLIRGPANNKVTLTVIRKGIKNSFEVSIMRGVIEIPTMETDQKDGVFIIKLYNFSAVSINLFRDGLRQFLDSGSDKLILDLRGNPGGYLEAAVDMASWFLPAGKIVVTEDFGKNADPIEYRSKGYNIFNQNGPFMHKLKMAILVNGGSASAAEILSGALKEQGIATLIGQSTFGKGSVQELINITPETSLKVTVARWLTPQGHSISNGGLTPDISVDLTADNVKAGLDPQLDRAVQFLNK